MLKLRRKRQKLELMLYEAECCCVCVCGLGVCVLDWSSAAASSNIINPDRYRIISVSACILEVAA